MNNIDWAKLIDLQYWLEGVAGASSMTPVMGRDSFFFWFFLYLFSSFLTLGVLLRLYQAFIRSDHPFQKQLPFFGNNFMWMGVLGLLWFTLRETSVGFLGARIWLLVGLLWFLVITILLVRYFAIFYRLEINYYNRITKEGR
ncbi:MAG: hypothetical protein AAGF07_04865 [Patescibacteria group bacterium]